MEPATEIPKADELFDLGQTEHAELLRSLGQAWEVVPRIAGYLEANLRTQQLGQALGQAEIRGNVFIGEGTVIESGALIQGPVWIGRNCRIGHGATLRDNVIIGDDCVVGHTVEVKNSILFNGCEVPHFNYVGDSVLGYCVHLGAGAKLSNYRLFRGKCKRALGQPKSGHWLGQAGGIDRRPNGAWLQRGASPGDYPWQGQPALSQRDVRRSVAGPTVGEEQK